MNEVQINLNASEPSGKLLEEKINNWQAGSPSVKVKNCRSVKKQLTGNAIRNEASHKSSKEFISKMNSKHKAKMSNQTRSAKSSIPKPTATVKATLLKVNNKQSNSSGGQANKCADMKIENTSVNELSVAKVTPMLQHSKQNEKSEASANVTVDSENDLTANLSVKPMQPLNIQESPSYAFLKSRSNFYSNERSNGYCSDYGYTEYGYIDNISNLRRGSLPFANNSNNLNINSDTFQWSDKRSRCRRQSDVTLIAIENQNNDDR